MAIIRNRRFKLYFKQYKIINKDIMSRVIVTGINRGLGSELIRIILKNNPEYEVIGTARSNVN